MRLRPLLPTGWRRRQRRRQTSGVSPHGVDLLLAHFMTAQAGLRPQFAGNRRQPLGERPFFILALQLRFQRADDRIRHGNIPPVGQFSREFVGPWVSDLKVHFACPRDPAALSIHAIMSVMTTASYGPPVLRTLAAGEARRLRMLI